MLHIVLYFFHIGFRLEQSYYSVNEDVGTLNLCATYRGENVPQTLEVKASIDPNSKPRTMMSHFLQNL